MTLTAKVGEKHKKNQFSPTLTSIIYLTKSLKSVIFDNSSRFYK